MQPVKRNSTNARKHSSSWFKSHCSISVLKYFLLVLILGFVFTGCDNDSNEENDPRIKGYYFWDDFILGESVLELYGLSVAPVAEFDSIRIIVYGDLPGIDSINLDPVADVSMQLSLLREEDDQVIGAPCSNTLEYKSDIDVFDGYIVPPNQGDWLVEFTWKNGDERNISYIELDVEQARPFARVIEHGVEFERNVTAWRIPDVPVIGVQRFTVQIWKSSLGLLKFEPDTTMLLDVAVQRTTNLEPSSNNTNPVHNENGFYSGEVNFPEPGGWTVLFLDPELIPEDTLAAFQFNL